MNSIKRGFTLIETVIVVSVLAIIMVSVTSILFNSMLAGKKADAGDVLEQNGNMVLQAIRNLFLNSDGNNVSCGTIGVGSTAIIFTNKHDGSTTAFDCFENVKIASESANSTNLFREQKLVVSGCDNFVTCDTFPSSGGRVSVADFSFVLTVGGTDNPAEYASRRFETKVVVRE